METDLYSLVPAIRVSRVIGARVLDESGRRLGIIDDIMLDKQSTAILCVVVSRVKFWGLSQSYLQLPWSSLHYDVFDRSYKVEGLRSNWSRYWRTSLDHTVNQS